MEKLPTTKKIYHTKNYYKPTTKKSFLNKAREIYSEPRPTISTFNTPFSNKLQEAMESQGNPASHTKKNQQQSK
ncbi:unnamed protein product [Ilex paraguariensis]|uniref:Uncharacterized protein n=1 Tax=Ilex paraguariensis TaxID=185542 RepID=A0ABC8QSI5_9AQUA